MRTMSIRSVFRCKLWLVMAMCLACLNANAQGGKGKNKKRNQPTQVKSATTKAEDTLRVVCEIFETPPQFPGGDVALMAYLKKEQQQPTGAEGVTGRVIVEFSIEKDGKITHARVVRSVHPALDKAALRIVRKMPKFIPGKRNGKPVCWKAVCVPISFK